MVGSRPLRVLLVANDGFSAGHVARAVAIARALARRASTRGIPARALLLTTSEAEPLLLDESLAVVRLPAPVAARRAGFADGERRRVVRGTIQGACDAFGPDLIVVDTFPSGPHDELAGLRSGARRALVRRAVRSGDDGALMSGLEAYDLAVVADDPTSLPVDLPIPIVRVPPITLGEPHDGRDRAAARRELDLPAEGRALLVAAGGGGDADAVSRAVEVAARLVRLAPDAVVVRAAGPLEPRGSREAPLRAGVRVVRLAPLQPYLSAFDGAFSAAGYNTAHELAKAGVPAALFAQPRAFDDQAARAVRFAELGLAIALDEEDDASIGAALAWMATTSPRRIAEGGADRAADVLLDLATASPREAAG